MSAEQASPILGRQDIGDVTVLRVQVPMLRGDETTEALFEQTASVVEDAGRSRLVLNLDGVVYLASMAIGKLVTLMRKARAAGGRLALCNVNPRLIDLLQTTHLADILLSYNDEREAVQSFG
jgi:anti-sigma B factor antagonist